MTGLLIVNALFALASAGFGVLAVVRLAAMPAAHAEGVAATFYARLFASRSVPLGIATAVVLLTDLGRPSDAIAWLVLAVVVQGLDAVIGIGRRRWGMVVGAAFATAVHAVTLAVVLACG